jgi:hypothetical protein
MTVESNGLGYGFSFHKVIRVHGINHIKEHKLLPFL